MLRNSVLLGRPHELPAGNQRQIVDLGARVEDAGLYGVQLGDHLLVGNRLDRYPYGKYRHEIESPWLEPISVLSSFAVRTSRIRLSMSVLIAPLRPAILLAKQLATLHVLSEGRREPGFGIGWQPEEYQASGVDWGPRQRISRDRIGACRVLWSSQPASFTSATVRFQEVSAFPRPVQDRMPILCGVKLSDSNVDLIAELGDGWAPPPTLSTEELGNGIKKPRGRLRDAGRSEKELVVRSFLKIERDDSGVIDLRRSLEGSREALNLGVDVLCFGFPAGYGSMFPSMTDLARFVNEMGHLAEAYPD
jgi:alkanesulfonate monooxygenase SsuD/methylene tetrahydromethanopterin reductase-like flavin-dependent oxidoreductase (luciferase family)